ncbi:MAG: hypothetical protein ABSG88_05250 [Bradyrhizobium sp.]|jgi:hypothetical protein
MSTDQPNVLQFFGRHLVALCVTFRYADQPNEPPQFRAYAGTLLALGGGVHFVTAGHILSELHNGLKDDRIVVLNAVLADTFGMGSHGMPIPFDIKSAPIFFIDDDEAGLDFGVVLLRPYYVRLLAANNTVAVQEENWINQHKVTFDGYLMLGLPEEFTSNTVDAEGIGQLSPTLLGVKKLDAPPAGCPVTEYPEFIGTLAENFGLRSVKGMSGGPIFGVSSEPPMRYWIIALQSSWLKDSRTVFGCSLPVFASLMTEWAKSVE